MDTWGEGGGEPQFAPLAISPADRGPILERGAQAQEAFLGEIRAILTEHISQLEAERMAKTALLRRLAEIQARLDAMLSLSQRPVPGAAAGVHPPTPTPIQRPVAPGAVPTSTAADRGAQFLRSTTFDQDGLRPAKPGKLIPSSSMRSMPDWQQAPLTHSPHPLRLVAELTTQMGSASARLVQLSPPVSLVLLRAQLHRGLAVQPDGDGASVTTVLLYRHAGPPPDSKALRVAYRLVDLLSLLTRDALLDQRYHEILKTQVQQRRLPLADGQAVHVDARARWRRTVPPTVADLRALLAEMSSSALSQVAHLLVQVSGQDPRTGPRLPGLLADFKMPIPDGSWVSDILPRAPRVENNAAARAEMPKVPAAQSVPRDFDMDRIAATRASSTLARKALVDLEEDQKSDLYQEEDTNGQEDTASRGEAVGLLTGAVLDFARMLSNQVQHNLLDVRDAAAQMGLVPLEAIRTINEWAERRSPDDSIGDVLVEVDEGATAVWVEPTLKELLA